MSLYDELTCDYPLPDVGVVDWSFQTQDLDEGMGLYRITADGYLEQVGYTYTHVPEEQRPYYGTAEWDRGIYRLLGMVEAAPFAQPVRLDYHGDVTFYDSRPDGWYEYKARFTEGKLQWIKRAEDS